MPIYLKLTASQVLAWGSISRSRYVVVVGDWSIVEDFKISQARWKNIDVRLWTDRRRLWVDTEPERKMPESKQCEKIQQLLVANAERRDHDRGRLASTGLVNETHL